VDNGTEFYRNGDGDRGCPEGIQRESTITFIQGEEPELIEASEPSICSYEFVFQINCKAAEPTLGTLPADITTATTIATTTEEEGIQTTTGEPEPTVPVPTGQSKLFNLRAI
jgi:hypothetical protein